MVSNNTTTNVDVQVNPQIGVEVDTAPLAAENKATREYIASLVTEFKTFAADAAAKAEPYLEEAGKQAKATLWLGIAGLAVAIYFRGR